MTKNQCVKAVPIDFFNVLDNIPEESLLTSLLVFFPTRNEYFVSYTSVISKSSLSSNRKILCISLLKGNRAAFFILKGFDYLVHIEEKLAQKSKDAREQYKSTN